MFETDDFILLLFHLDFKPRDSSNDARKRRKAIQKSKRYHVIKSRPTDNANSGKDMVAIKTLKGKDIH